MGDDEEGVSEGKGEGEGVGDRPCRTMEGLDKGAMEGEKRIVSE